VADNLLTGELPSFVGPDAKGLGHMSYLSVRNNFLTGTIPVALGTAAVGASVGT
jgi:hypothetical protein